MSDIPKDPRIGTVLGDRYRIDGELGRGGMGTVYRGVQLSVDRPVAIKLISHQVASQPQYVQRFKREAKVTSQLTHPHTIQVHDFGETDDGALYLVVELLEGRELSALIEELGPLPPARALRLIQMVLKSLAEAHDQGIVHRDLKPDNIFLRNVAGEGDFVKVMDFGVASAAVAADTTKLTMEGSLVGTPAYMSPEQAQGKPAGAAADVYALGVVLYELLTGRVPFVADTAVSLLVMHVSQAPAPLQDSLSGTPHPALQSLLDRWLDKDPARRTPTAAQALAEVEETLAALEGDRGALAAATLAGAGAASTSSAPKMAALGAGVVALIVGGWWLASGNGDGRQAEPAPVVQPEPQVAEAAPKAEAATEAIANTLEATDAPAPKASAEPRSGQKKRSPRQRARSRAATDSPTATAATAGPPATPTPAAATPAPPPPAPTLTAATKRPPPPPPPALSVPTSRPTPSKAMPPATTREAHRARRLHMAAHGTPYPNVASVRRALDGGRIARADYDDVVWALKRRYKNRVAALKTQYKAGQIDRATYNRLAAAAKRDYAG